MSFVQRQGMQPFRVVSTEGRPGLGGPGAPVGPLPEVPVGPVGWSSRRRHTEEVLRVKDRRLTCESGGRVGETGRGKTSGTTSRERTPTRRF